MDTQTDAKKLEVIAFIADRHAAERNDEEGDKYLSDADLAMEAIDAVLSGWQSNGALRAFLDPRP